MEDKAKYGVSYIAADPKEIRFDGNENEPWNVSQFRSITQSLVALYKEKNEDYGNSFERRVLKYGLSAALTHISEKFDRIESLIMKGGENPNFESLNDSLVDLANFSIMTIMALREREISEVDFENEK